jgi:hypothetical protein
MSCFAALAIKAFVMKPLVAQPQMAQETHLFARILGSNGDDHRFPPIVDRATLGIMQ